MNHELDPYLTNYSCLPLATVEKMLALREVIMQAVRDGLHSAVEADLRIRALQKSVELIRQREERRRQAKLLRDLEEKRWG